VDIIIVCHTEFGHVVHGRGIRKCVPPKSSVQGVEEGVKRLVQVADAFGAKVTFAVMPETVRSFPDVTHEIGLHVHPGWVEIDTAGTNYVVGDAWLREHCKQSKDSAFLVDYPFSEQLEMIKAGKDRLLDSLGIEPKVFVAGMWSLNNDTVKALVSTRFSHECSAVAHAKTAAYDWSRISRICMPYHPHTDDYQKRGSMPLLIVPISQMLLGGSVNPEAVPKRGLSWLKACFLEYFQQNLPTFHICLHSQCMTDPFFVEAMRSLLQFISKYEVQFRFASEITEDRAVRAQTKLLPYLRAINRKTLRPAALSAAGKAKQLFT